MTPGIKPEVPAWVMELSIKVQGNVDYIPVAARVLWLRSEHPNWGFDSKIIELNFEKRYAIFQTKIFDENGMIISTGTKIETAGGFGDYLEKAETGSIGRALAAAGYVTPKDLGDEQKQEHRQAPVQQQAQQQWPSQPPVQQRQPLTEADRARIKTKHDHQDATMAWLFQTDPAMGDRVEAKLVAGSYPRIYEMSESQIDQLTAWTAEEIKKWEQHQSTPNATQAAAVVNDPFVDELDDPFAEAAR